MQTHYNNRATTPSSLPANRGRRTKRASIACVHCHDRKVRCDVAMHGSPCTNCRLDRKECRKRASKALKLPQRRRCSQEDSRDISSQILLGAISENENAPIRRASCTIPRCGSPSVLPRESNAWKISGVPFSYYGFLNTVPLWRLKESEIMFLEFQGCLHLPTSLILETFLNFYFLYVHPCLPVIDEAKMWRIFRHSEASQEQYSLLLLQAMLCAAAPFIPAHIAKEGGSPSIVAMRNDLYQRTKLLYSSGIEDDHLTLSQTALLLSLFNSSTDAMCNSTWLSLAIEHAKVANAHQYDSRPPKSLENRCKHKRLWWSCILRDRVISLGMRRPIQIVSDDILTISDLSTSLEDPQSLHSDSEVYQPDVKSALVKLFIQQCQFAVIVTDLLMTLYTEPCDSLMSEASSSDTQWEQLERFELSLSLWYTDFMTSVEYDISAGHRSVSLFVSLTSIYYQAARLALCNYASRLVTDLKGLQTKRKRLEYYKHELHEAVVIITSEINDLIAVDMAKYVPSSVMALTLLPMILWGINVVLSSTPPIRDKSTEKLSLFRMMNYMYSLRFDVSRFFKMVKATLQFIKPEILKIALGARRSTTVSFSDFFEQEPQSYAHLYLYLDHLLSDKRMIESGADGESILVEQRQQQPETSDPLTNINTEVLGSNTPGICELVSFPPAEDSSLSSSLRPQNLGIVIPEYWESPTMPFNILGQGNT